MRRVEEIYALVCAKFGLQLEAADGVLYVYGDDGRLGYITPSLNYAGDRRVKAACRLLQRLGLKLRVSGDGAWRLTALGA